MEGEEAGRRLCVASDNRQTPGVLCIASGYVECRTFYGIFLFAFFSFDPVTFLDKLFMKIRAISSLYLQQRLPIVRPRFQRYMLGHS